MGANLSYVSVKGKTEAAIKKEFWAKVHAAADRVADEDVGYSGTCAEFNALIFTTRVFDTHEELDAWIEPKDKNTAYAVQVKVIKDSPTIAKWICQIGDLQRVLWNSTSEKEKARVHKQVDAIRAKIKAARGRKAAASKRTEWVVLGWVSE